ncbi:MAG: LacI family DNA-binding transcriptional regulator, partial [Puniceicoccales bacterium]
MDKPRRNPTLKDIAEHTGFGRSTISLALRGSPSLPEKTRRIIQDAAKELGYRP